MSTELKKPNTTDKLALYQTLLDQIKALIDPNCGWVANYANTCAAIQQYFNHWWCGFYIVNKKNQLELGPFIGPVACTLINYNKGVCGKAWADSLTTIVPNVHEFEGHIACSSESNSEIVVPIIKNKQVLGVIDLDSKNFSEFDILDKEYLEKIAELLSEIPVNL
ncbi:MAG: GAF domain-containing protein [bacterium]|nr:GAF domain-containing protein [bacterium]